MSNLPRRFCVTKVGPYSKQIPDLIIQRKNNERRAGHGVFWWGFSEERAPAVRAFGFDCERKGEVPHLVFIAKKTNDHHAMGQQVIWGHYKDLAVGKVCPVPPHVIMLRDASKTSKYYALICHSEAALRRGDLECFRSGQYQNLNGPQLEPGNSPGSSQTTSVVRRRTTKNVTGSIDYKVIMRAVLVSPYAVEMKNGVPAEDEQPALIDRASRPDIDPSDWTMIANALRNS